MSNDLFEPTDYDRLTLSLLSPLPNEQDFAVNVATLLSNEGRHTLKLGRCPRLLDLLLSHAGVFNHRKFICSKFNRQKLSQLVKFLFPILAPTFLYPFYFRIFFYESRIQNVNRMRSVLTMDVFSHSLMNLHD